MKYNWQNHFILIFITFTTILFAFQCNAQPPNSSTATTSARELDSLLQNYAYRSFDNPITGKIYEANPPSNLTGIEISIIRLRTGSLRSRGVKNLKEFQIPTRINIKPYVTRLAFVYQNLGNWSSFYYPLPGFAYLTPVIGLLAYNAADLDATNLKELDLVASGSPISIKFAHVSSVPNGQIARCVYFDLNGLPSFKGLVIENVCSTYKQGHFAIVVNGTVSGLAPAPNPNPAPGLAPTPGPNPGPGSAPSGKRSSKSRIWKIAVGVVCGFLGLVLLAFLLVWFRRCNKNKKMTEMERRAEVGESLQMARVGEIRAPVALGTRTKPILENEDFV